MKFKNKVVVITGAAGGIGTEITKRFLNEGAEIAAVDVSTEALEKLSDQLGKPGNAAVI
jgi:NADP-dependent 3-hydroxy acid dehydrogenase YdfG